MRHNRTSGDCYFYISQSSLDHGTGSNWMCLLSGRSFTPSNKNTKRAKVIFIGLLTDQQKQAGYFVSQDEDFIYLFHNDEGFPRCIGIFPYETATVKEIRDKASEDTTAQREVGNDAVLHNL